MPYQVEFIEDRQNVILVTYTGAMTAQDVSQSVADLVDLASGMPRPIYQVGDFRQATGTFSRVLDITHMFPAMMRIYKDEQIIGPFVVNKFDNQWLRLSLNLLSKMNIERFLTFETIEAALDFIDVKTQNSEV